MDAENRNPLIAPKQLYAAVWKKLKGDRGTASAIRWSQADFAARFDSEVAAGKRLVHMQAYDVGGGIIARDGVWEKAPAGTTTTRAIGWSQTDFATRFDSEIKAGKRLAHMQAYNTGTGVIARDGVWENGSRDTTRALGWSKADFATRFGSEITAGRHCVHMQAYDVGTGVIARDGVWEDGGSNGTAVVMGWSQADFVAQFSSELALGKHLLHMQAYRVGNTVAYDGIWENGNRAQTYSVRFSFNDFVAKNESEQAAGRQLLHFQAYNVGDGQLAYDGVWAKGAAQEHTFGETMIPFVDRFSARTSAGYHLVAMHTFLGR